MGASTIITGLSSRIAQTLVDLGVDLAMRTVGDLQGGLEEAERLLVHREDEPAPGTGARPAAPPP